MNEEMQQNPPLQENQTLPPPSDSVLHQPRKSNKKNWIIGGVVIGILCLCALVCVAVFGASMFKVFTEKAPVETVINTYMQYMAGKDADSAYELFSPRAQRQFSISAINELLEGNNYFLFEGYQGLSATNLNISISANADPDLPQGTVAEVTGTLDFEGDIQGSFSCVLEKVGDQWMIYNINITVPPDKIK